MSDNKTSDNDKEDTKIIVKTSKTNAYRPPRNTTKPTTVPIRQNMTKTKKKNRVTMYDFSNLQFGVINTAKSLDEGCDIPGLNLAIILCNTSSATQKTQRVNV